MKVFKTTVFALFFLLPWISLTAGERTIPVDMYILVDKSLSMAEPGKFETMHSWVRDQLLGQMLINGDTITLYQFYGETDLLLSLTIGDEADRQRITSTIDAIKPDGKYTDIGLALDTLKADLGKRQANDRYTVLLLLTDLKQEAPWSSRYAGSPENFKSPYLAEARILQHDAWYEITLDMDIQDRVVTTTKSLYSSILETSGTEHAVLADNVDGTVTEDQLADSGTDGSGKTVLNEGNDPESNGSSPTRKSPLPSPVLLVVVSAVLLAGLAATVVVVRRNRNKKEEKNTQYRI